MRLRSRTYEADEDYWRIRSFLRSLGEDDPRPSGTWHVGVFDYWRWHWLKNVVEREPDDLRIWESQDGEIVAILIQGDPGVCHPLVDPRGQTRELEHEMIAAAEEHMSAASPGGEDVVCIWADEADACRRLVLEERGYETFESPRSTEFHSWQPTMGPREPSTAPTGYRVRSMGDVDELPARSLASWRAFHPDEPDEGHDPTGGWYRNVQRAPLYRRDLDVVAVTDDGEIASFSLCFFDDVSRTGVFVLDGTAASHQRIGLGKAVMLENLRRLHDLGALRAYVSWYEPPAGALYRSVGFREVRTARAWRRFV